MSFIKFLSASLLVLIFNLVGGFLILMGIIGFFFAPAMTIGITNVEAANAAISTYQITSVILAFIGVVGIIAAQYIRKQHLN